MHGWRLHFQLIRIDARRDVEISIDRKSQRSFKAAAPAIQSRSGNGLLRRVERMNIPLRMVRGVIEPETQAVGRQLDVLIADAVSGKTLDQAVAIVRAAYEQFLGSLVIEMRSHIKGEAESFLRVIGRKRSRVAERKQR